MKKLLPIIFVFLAALVLIKGLMPSRYSSPFPVADFGKIPVLEGGRYKPLDSVARTSLLLLRGKQYTESPSGVRIEAIEWLMQVALNPERAGNYQVFLIDHDAVKTLIGCKELSRRYFSYSEIIPHAKVLDERIQRIPRETALQDAAQREMMKLYRNLTVYRRLAFSLRVPLMQSTVEGEYVRFMESLEFAANKLKDNPEGDPEDEDLKRVSGYARNFGSLSDDRSMKFVPVTHGGAQWLNLSDALMLTFRTGQVNELLLAYARLSDAYINGNTQVFEEHLTQIQDFYQPYQQEISGDKVLGEFFVNTLQPFTTTIVFYVLIMIAIFVAWLVMDEKLLVIAFWMLFIACLMHSLGMFARMWIQGRPPVTNLYSSAVFVGWGGVVLGLVLERIFKSGVGGAVACMVGIITLIVANHLMASGDTMEMMRAVLDSNFWLATHVITISLGYSSTYIAGFLALLYVVLGVFTKRLDPSMEQNLMRMVYGIVCFSLLFSFVGTVLGGIWADQSWGRFWGWDPKENGALMIVIWNALVLHAKRSGMVRHAGFMNLAIFGNIITSWSWFGTNMLGVGLHSYGFMSSAFIWLLSFCFSQILIMSLVLVPQKYWRSRS